MSYVRRRISTDAFNAREEFMEVLHDNESFCYKPWQFQNAEVCADTLKTTYDEIAIWGLHEAMLRPGFKIEEGVVHVPNIFSKVNGVSKNLEDYMKAVDSLAESKNTLFFKKLPMMRFKKVKNAFEIYKSVLDNKGLIDKNRLLSSEHWKYRSLKPALQEAITDRIIALCCLPSFWKYKNFKIKMRLKLINRIQNYFLFMNDFDAKDQYFMKVSTFMILTNLSEDFINLLQNFDYPMAIPKIIIYNNGDGNNFSFSDALILMFMNSMGVDTMIYNPSGKSDIENFIKEDFYDSHVLELLGAKVPFRKSGFLKGII